MNNKSIEMIREAENKISSIYKDIDNIEFINSKKVLDAFITGRTGVCQCFAADSLKLCAGMLFSKFHYSHACPVGLLLDPAGRKHSVYNDTCIRADLLRPASEPVTVPFKVLLVVCRHVLLDC